MTSDRFSHHNKASAHRGRNHGRRQVRRHRGVEQTHGRGTTGGSAQQEKRRHGQRARPHFGRQGGAKNDKKKPTVRPATYRLAMGLRRSALSLACVSVYQRHAAMACALADGVLMAVLLAVWRGAVSVSRA
jgi:hypothetical protein